jgi:hypothetical protein
MIHYFELTCGIEAFFSLLYIPQALGNEQMKSTIVTIIYS